MGNREMARDAVLMGQAASVYNNRGVWVAWTGALFVFAFSLRLVANSSLPVLAGDAVSHEAKALSLLQNQGYRLNGPLTSFKPPGYPAFLAIVYRVFGHRHQAVIWAQSLLGALTCLLIAAIGIRIGLPGRGLLGGFLAAGSPSLVRAAGLLLSETLVTFLLAASIWLGICMWQDRRKRLAFAWGTTVGLLVLTRSVMMLFPIMWVAVMYALLKRQSRHAELVIVKPLLVGLIVCASVVAPWTWRNWKVHGALIPVSTDGGRAFYSSYRPPHGDQFGLNANDETALRAEAIDSEVARDRFYYAAAWSWIGTHAGELPKLLVLKFLLLASPVDWELISRDGSARWNWLYTVTLPFTLVGAWALRRRKELPLLLLPIGYVLFMTAVFYGSPRFRLPIEPHLLLLAAAGIERVVGQHRTRFMPASVVAPK